AREMQQRHLSPSPLVKAGWDGGEAWHVAPPASTPALALPRRGGGDALESCGRGDETSVCRGRALPSSAGHSFSHRTEQLIERIGEQLHPFFEQLSGHLLHGNAHTLQGHHSIMRFFEVLFEAGTRTTVVAERVERGGRHGVNRIASDQFLH